MRFTDIGLLLASLAPTDSQGGDTSDEKEDAIHDSEGEAGLEHGAWFVDIIRDAVDGDVAEDAKTDGRAAAGRDVAAVGGGNEAQFVDAGD